MARTLVDLFRGCTQQLAYSMKTGQRSHTATLNFLIAALLFCAASQADASLDGNQFTRQETYTISPDGDTGLAELTIELPPGEFALVTLENLAYPAAMSLVSDQATLKQGYSENDIFLTQLLIEPGMCADCRVRIEVPYGKKSDLNLALSVNYASQVNQSKLILEKTLEEIMLDNWEEKPTLGKKQLLTLRNPPNNTGLQRYCYHANTITDQPTLNLVEIYYNCHKQLKEVHLAAALQFKTRYHIQITEKFGRRALITEIEEHVENIKNTELKEQTIKYFILAEALMIAGIRNANIGQHKKAEEQLNDSIKLFSLTDHHMQIARSLANKAENLRFQNKLQAASKILKQALTTLNKSVNDHPLIYEHITYLAAGYSMQSGELYTAIRLLDYLDNKNGKSYNTRHSHRLALRARTLLELRRFKESKEFYKLAWQSYEESGQTAHLVTLAKNLTRLHTELSEFEQARHYLKIANEMTDSSWGFDQQFQLDQASIKYHQANNSPAIALQKINELESKLAETDNHYRLGRVLFQKGEILHSLGQNENAFRAVAQSLAHAEKADDRLYLVKANMLAATILFTLQRLDQARGYIDQAIARIEKTRKKLLSVEEKQALLSVQAQTFQLAVDIAAINAVHPMDGIHYAEMFRARTLFDTLTNSALNQVFSAGNWDYSASAIDDIVQDTAEDDAVPHITYDDLITYQQQLNKDTAVWYFSLGESTGHSWLITRDDIKHHALPNTQAIREQVEAISQQLSQPPAGGRIAAQRQADLIVKIRALSDSLLGPSKEVFTNVQNLVAVPDGALHALPIGLLSATTDHSYRPLARDLQVTYASSLATAITLDNKPSSTAASLSMLMMANSESTALKEKANHSASLSSLANVRSEALEIAKLWSNRGDVLSLLDEQASKTNFHEAQPDRFGILHFASHAVVDWEHPAHSAIKLYDTDSQDPFTYSDLTFSDISQMNINAELVVLAACETARGKNISGEGPIGLSRAFFEAGAKRVIASLWPVEDDSTASLLKEFYHQLAQGKSPVEALHSAQRYLQSHPSYSHPYYWAGFILVGASDNWPQL